jgi:biotin carboxylase
MGTRRRVVLIGKDCGAANLAIAENVELITIGSGASCCAGSSCPPAIGASSITVNVLDREAVHSAISDLTRSRNVDGVFSLDPSFVTLAAESAARLGLPSGNPVVAAHRADDKHLTCARLSEAGVKVPRFELVGDLADVNDVGTRFPVPCVVKPLNDSNSRLVQLCRTEKEFQAAVEKILSTETNLVGYPLRRGVLVQEYIDGPEFSVEVAAGTDHVQVLAVCRKQSAPLPYFVETGHTTPPDCSPAISAAVAKIAIAAVEAIGLRNVVAHVEVRLRKGQPHIIEINARPAGGMIPQLVEHTTGWNLHAIAIRLAAGLQLPARKESRAHVGIYQCITVEHSAVIEYDLRKLNHFEAAVQPHVGMDVESGTIVHPVNHRAGRIAGRILAYGDTHAAVWELLRKIRIAMRLRTRELREEVETGCGSELAAWQSGCC